MQVIITDAASVKEITHAFVFHTQTLETNKTPIQSHEVKTQSAGSQRDYQALAVRNTV